MLRVIGITVPTIQSSCAPLRADIQTRIMILITSFLSSDIHPTSHLSALTSSPLCALTQGSHSRFQLRSALLLPAQTAASLLAAPHLIVSALDTELVNEIS
eukprot:3389022-Rhodomonas_salina.3